MKTLNHNLMQEFKESDRLNPSIEKQLPIENELLPTIDRSEFARDRDRILFSRAFRRLQHKAQVFSNESGDHYRTRLTHTLEVSQISRSLARYLQADEYLAEAIAVGHDIGHTPFGHQGERVLDEVMMGKDDLGLISCHFDFGGFKHNYNSVRVLDVNQSKFANYDGLNLSWQVLEGILKHTKVRRPKNKVDNTKSWDVKRFIGDSSLENRLYLKYKDSYLDHSVTLEGQIVAIADEIAQRQHDIDDGLRNEKLRMNVDDIYSKIIKICEMIISDEKAKSSEQPNASVKLLTNLKEKLLENDKLDTPMIKKDSLVRDIIEYFILDVFNQTRQVIQNGVELENDEERRILNQHIVAFSEVGNAFNDELETLVKNQILNSYEVNKFDGKSRFIIRQLFKAYYTNPFQMPSYALNRLEKSLKASNNCDIELLLDNGISIKMKEINFKTMNRSESNALVSSLKLEEVHTNVQLPSQLKSLFKEKDNDSDSSMFYEKLKDIHKEKEKTTKEDVLLKCLIENHYMYLASICDYIAGMSDNYAKKEYKELYLVD